MALFSLKDSNSTSSGAKSLFLPSPYSIKMAFISQAISLGSEDFKNDTKLFAIIRDAEISYCISGEYCVNKCFVKIQEIKENKEKREHEDVDELDTFSVKNQIYGPTICFREYIYINGDLELIFDVSDQSDVCFLKKYLHTINYFGKRGCFYQFIKYNDTPNEPNVRSFDANSMCAGVIQEFDDFDHSLSFDNVNSYSKAKTKRKKRLLVLPLECTSSSKSYSCYRVIKT